MFTTSDLRSRIEQKFPFKAFIRRYEEELDDASAETLILMEEHAEIVQSSDKSVADFIAASLAGMTVKDDVTEFTSTLYIHCYAALYAGKDKKEVYEAFVSLLVKTLSDENRKAWLVAGQYFAEALEEAGITA